MVGERRKTNHNQKHSLTFSFLPSVISSRALIDDEDQGWNNEVYSQYTVKHSRHARLGGILIYVETWMRRQLTVIGLPLVYSLH